MIEVLRLLNEVSQGSSRYSHSYYCRTLDKHEPLPQIGHGIPDGPLIMKDWVWVAYSSFDDKPVAIIIASPMQGIAFLMRIYAIPSIKGGVLLGLLRKTLADLLSRGYTRYATCLSEVKVGSNEARLFRLIKKAGGRKIEGGMALFDGPTDIGRL